MNFTFEIPDETIAEAVEMQAQQFKAYEHGGKFNLSNIIAKHVEDAIKNGDYADEVKKQIDAIAMREIKNAAESKVPGWIRRHIKEALKYAHAKFLAEDT